MTPDEKKIYMKEYRQKNKEKIRQKVKEYKQKNKDNIKQYNKEYRQTENGKKTNRISEWKKYGVIHDNFDELYKLYLNTTECMVCKKTFKNTKDRCLDHDHETGEYRQILCRYCNNQDNWQNKF